MLTSLKNRLLVILKKSERYTKTDMKYLLGGGFWITFGQLITGASGLILSYAFANLIPPEVFGNYRFILSVAGVLGALTLPGLATSVVRAVALNERGVFAYSLMVRMRWGVLASVAALGIAIYYYVVEQHTELALALVVAAVFLPLFEPVQMYSSYLSGKKDFKRTSMYVTLAHIAGTLGVVSALFYSTELLSLVIAYFAFYTAAHAIMLMFVVNKYHEVLVDGATHTDTIEYGKHLSYINGFYVITNHIDKVLVFYFLGPIELAIYTFATLFPDYIRNMTRTISTVALPKFAERSINEIGRTIYARMMLFGVFLLAIAGIYALLAPYIFALLFPQYLASIPYTQLLSLTILGALMSIPNTILKAHKKVRELYTLQITGSVIQICSLVIGIAFFGIMGAIVARIGARILQAGLGSIYLNKIFTTPN